MKRTVFYLIGLVLTMTIVGFIACSSDDEPEPTPAPEPIPYMTIEPENLVIDSEKQQVMATLSTNLDNVMMTYQNGSKWVRLKDTHVVNKEKTEYVFDVDANESEELRVEIVVFKSGNKSEAITIVQNPAEN